ncbi:MAG: hypothetical protein LBP87_03045 [Planctomycetaceae bacterium]|jgi:hypothetical protein|nr:hypothetical protein [Planctomycetaceae bacterium]
MKKLHYVYLGYTLIELLIAVSLSLLLLLGVTEMFRHVGSTMSDTQKSLNMSANLNAVAMTLRSDLEGLERTSVRLPHRPSDMVDPAVPTVVNSGYLEITEGMNAPYRITTPTGLHVSIMQVAANSENNPPTYDQTVGDMDDILAFTAQADAGYSFRGLINNNMSESSAAEIIWFARGTTLYRRVLLIDQNVVLDTESQSRFYERNDLSARNSGGTITPNSMAHLARRENRFAHFDGGMGSFPFPLYNPSNEVWYYLRMPTLEETVHSTWQPGQSLPTLDVTNLQMNGTPISTLPAVPYWDFWNNPNGLSGGTAPNVWEQNTTSGSLSNLVTTPRHSRAGEDIVMKNVLSFDVKVWNPYWVPCRDSSNNYYWAAPQYINLGQDSFAFINPITQQEEFYPVVYNFNFALPPAAPGATPLPPNYGYGFTLKGRYNTAPTSTNTRRTLTDTSEEWHMKERLSHGGAITNDNQLWTSTLGPSMPCVFDSWTTEYEYDVGTPQTVISGNKGAGYVSNPTDATTWRCPPPYTEDLKSIQVTIRCFDPQSKHIKQVRVVQDF